MERFQLLNYSSKTSRSGGPGGQNVNKLETRVEVLFDLAHSPIIPDHIRQRLLNGLTSQIDSSGILHVVAQDTRSQWKNKQLAIERLADLLKSALIVRKNELQQNQRTQLVKFGFEQKKHTARLNKCGRFQLKINHIL